VPARGGVEAKKPSDPIQKTSFKEAVEALEVRLLREALEEARFNQRRAANLLGLRYHQFRGILKKYKGAGHID
jgi:psp operon transcriptional activator